MRKIAPLKPPLRKAQCKPFGAQGKRVRHPTSKPDVAECYASRGMKCKLPSMRYPSRRSYTRKTAPLKSKGAAPNLQTRRGRMLRVNQNRRRTSEVRNDGNRYIAAFAGR